MDTNKKTPKKRGRPSGRVHDTHVRIAMPAVMASELEVLAEAQKMSKSAVMRDAFERYAAQRLLPSDRARIRYWSENS